MEGYESLIPGVVDWWVTKEHLLDCFALAAQTVEHFKATDRDGSARRIVRSLAYDDSYAHTTATTCYRTAFGE